MKSMLATNSDRQVVLNRSGTSNPSLASVCSLLKHWRLQRGLWGTTLLQLSVPEHSAQRQRRSPQSWGQCNLTESADKKSKTSDTLKTQLVSRGFALQGGREQRALSRCENVSIGRSLSCLEQEYFPLKWQLDNRTNNNAMNWSGICCERPGFSCFLYC